MNEIRQKVAEVLRADHLATLREKLTGNIFRARIRSRSRSRKRNIWSPFFTNLAIRTYSDNQRPNGNHVDASNEWNRDVRSAIRKYWKSYFDPHVYRRNFPIVNMKIPTARRVCKLVNKLHKTLVVTRSGISGSDSVLTLDCEYIYNIIL